MPKHLLGSLLLFAFLNAPATAAEPADLRIGLYDTLAAGGQGADIEGLLGGLTEAGYSVERFSNLQPLTLARFDLVYLSDMHAPGDVHRDWRRSLTEYVQAGGSVLQTWHHHALGEVGQGVQRIYNRRAMHVVPGHPAIAGIDDFQARADDHIIERVGPHGTVLLKNDAGQPVAVAGELGRGKVISTGLALAIPEGQSKTRAPVAEEARLLRAFSAWLVPDVPREERLALLAAKPRLCVLPSKVIVAAGRPAEFRIDISGPEVGTAEVACGGARVEEIEGPDSAPTVRSFRLVKSTTPGVDQMATLNVTANIGQVVLRDQVTLEAAWGGVPKNERRGVWLHARADRHPETVMPELARLGINMAVVRIAGGTAAFYASKVQPDVQDPLAPEGDWLAEAVEHAHANGIEIHPYLNNCVVEGRTSAESLRRLREAGRLQVGPDGEPIDWFCPSQDVNFVAIEAPMLEIVANYDVDGIQYDFIRYPNSRGCFCDVCRERFERESGERVKQWPEDCIRGDRHQEWVDYRAGRISALVERISTKIRVIDPEVEISAAVFRDWPDCRENNGQDWVLWCQRGWLDTVCPMNYTLDTNLFAERAAIHRNTLPVDFPVLQGIGIASAGGTMHSAEQVAVQIALARKYGACGWVGFAYQPGHTTPLLEPLKLD